MKSLIQQIQIGSVREALEILEKAGSENLFEKAKHQIGDMHPNGKWVWTQLPSGKFDWRVAKGRKAGNAGNAGQAGNAGNDGEQALATISSKIDKDVYEYSKKIYESKSVDELKKIREKINDTIISTKNKISQTKNKLEISKLEGNISGYETAKQAVEDILKEKTSQVKPAKKETKSTTPKIDTETIDQAIYDKQYNDAMSLKGSDEVPAESSIQFGLSTHRTLLKETKKKLEETLQNRPGAKATIAKLQKDLTKFVSTTKAMEQALEDRGKKTSTGGTTTQVKPDTTEKKKQISKADVEKFIGSNYETDGELTFRTDESSGKIIVDCSDSIRTNKDITKLTDGTFMWGKIGGDFSCRRCDKLESLEGAPEKVGEMFDCSHCENLTSLKGAPKEVGGDFSCVGCENLESLEGAPKKVSGDFSCRGCDSLESLEGAPKKVGKDFICTYCKNLTSLKGSPREVGRDFDCTYCKNLTSLYGVPKEVGRDFICSSCRSLKSLVGAPTEVGRDFDCKDCSNLTSLDGAPTEVGEDFNCSNCNKLKSLEGAPYKVRYFNCIGCDSLTSLDGAPEEGKIMCDDRLTETKEQKKNTSSRNKNKWS